MCGTCREAIPTIEPSLCPEAPSQIDDLRAVAWYEGTLREAIHQFKYRQLRGLRHPLGQMLGEYLHTHPLPVEVIVPVPLHPTRERERGYNQSQLLAEELGETVKLPVRAELLARTRATPPQVGLSLWERRENVRGAFLCPGLGPKEGRVLLVDDVCASGATMEACAQALYAAGAEGVWGLVLARPSWVDRKERRSPGGGLICP